MANQVMEDLLEVLELIVRQKSQDQPADLDTRTATECGRVDYDPLKVDEKKKGESEEQSPPYNGQ